MINRIAVRAVGVNDQLTQLIKDRHPGALLAASRMIGRLSRQKTSVLRVLKALSLLAELEAQQEEEDG